MSTELFVGLFSTALLIGVIGFMGFYLWAKRRYKDWNR